MFIYAVANEVTIIDCYTVNVPANVCSKSQLMSVLEDEFKFPYFGKNWDSLLDLLSDFSWIKNSNVCIYHFGIKHLNADDLLDYIQVLEDAMKRLNDFPPPTLYAIFCPFDRSIIEYLRHKIN